MTESPLQQLLAEHHDELLAFVINQSGARLRRYETPEDIVQGILTSALRYVDDFEYRGDEQFFAWLYQLARRHIYDRVAYWSAVKRRSTNVLRIAPRPTESQPGVDPPDPATSPSGFASRREQIVILSRAIDALKERDQELVRWSGDEVPLAEMAERLGVSYEAAERARLRAFERLRKVYRTIAGPQSQMPF